MNLSERYPVTWENLDKDWHNASERAMESLYLFWDAVMQREFNEDNGTIEVASKHFSDHVEAERIKAVLDFKMNGGLP